ncbi:sugar phosphate isomerase/epimerase family protein [Microbacterium indicum]|uniref:sugar phosphate isomerase/epimerase family protein n=1 Tax=Microbacterium indicum TaxID=358100 RepID=UPI000410530B|nr:sugar phosphate isomerase/epimerase [Microbacterium indicum]
MIETRAQKSDVTHPSLQLYTVRHELERDLSGAIARVAGIGFRQVEPFGFVDRADALRAALDSAGLAAPTAHGHLVGADDLEAVFEAATTLGVSTLIDPHVPVERWRSEESIREIAAELDEIARAAAAHGLAVGYHNHEFEFENRFDGVAGYEVLAGAVSAGVLLEVDTYWAAVGGESDVPALLERLGDQVTALHVKDGPLTKDDIDQVAVGSGSMDVPAILAAAPQALRVVELDDFAGDVFDAVEASFSYLAGVTA